MPLILEYFAKERISFANGLAGGGSRRGDTWESEVSFTKLGKLGKARKEQFLS